MRLVKLGLKIGFVWFVAGSTKEWLAAFETVFVKRKVIPGLEKFRKKLDDGIAKQKEAQNAEKKEQSVEDSNEE